MVGNEVVSSLDTDWKTDIWESAPYTEPVAPPIKLPKNTKGAAWIETKYNKGKTLGYRVMRWRDGDNVSKSGNPIKRMMYVRRLGGVYHRKQPQERVNREHLVGEYVVRAKNTQIGGDGVADESTKSTTDGNERVIGGATEEDGGQQGQTDPIEP